MAHRLNTECSKLWLFQPINAYSILWGAIQWKYRANVEINTDLNFFNTSDEIENKFETLGINNLNKFTDTYDKTINYEKENNLESENKTDKILDSNNETINNDKNIENDKVEIEDENNIKIKNIDPSSIVTVYDYKEI